MTDIMAIGSWLKLWLTLGVPLFFVWYVVVEVFIRPKSRIGLAVRLLVGFGVLVLAPLTWMGFLWLERAVQPFLYGVETITYALLPFVWLPLALVGLAGFGFAGFLLWRWERERTVVRREIRQELVGAPPPAQPQPGTFLPDDLRSPDSAGW